MKKAYLPRPSGVPGANNPRRVFSTVPLEIDLAHSLDRFHCLQLQEPELVFGGGRRCVDPRTGLAAYGPQDVSRPQDAGQLRVGIVGTTEAIDKAIALLQEISRPIEQDLHVDCVQNPSFPGINSEDPFRVHLVTQSQWHRALHKWNFRSLGECSDSSARSWLLQEMFGEQVRAISELENPPHVVICAISEPIGRLLVPETARHDYNFESQDEVRFGSGERLSSESLRNLKNGLKTECMGYLPTEIIWDQPYSKTKETRDRATRAWNLSLALLYKARMTAWGLANASEASCFIGISYYRPSPRASSETFIAFAHAVTEHGNGIVVDGAALKSHPTNNEHEQPSLDEMEASRFLAHVLAAFEKETGIAPRKVVVHKCASYSDVERAGFGNALRNVREYGLITITRRGVFCVRPGRKPILRGMAIPFDEKLGLVFSSGYIPFLHRYPRKKIPEPLEITENWGSMSFQQAGRDLIRLTKLDLNSCEFCTDLPITLARNQEIRGVLEAQTCHQPHMDDRYYL